jgi:uncharacterized protein
MKLQPDRVDTLSVTSHGPGWFAINGERFSQSLLISSFGHKIKWPCESLSDLKQSHFDLVLELPVEIVLFGCGSKHHHINPHFFQTLISRRIGLESMDTVAACRTFNILASEHRNVAAILLTTDPD